MSKIKYIITCAIVVALLCLPTVAAFAANNNLAYAA